MFDPNTDQKYTKPKFPKFMFYVVMDGGIIIMIFIYTALFIHKVQLKELYTKRETTETKQKMQIAARWQCFFGDKKKEKKEVIFL